MEKEMRINHTDYKGGNNESSKRGPAPPSSRAACFPGMTELRFESIDTGKEIRLSTSSSKTSMKQPALGRKAKHACTREGVSNERGPVPPSSRAACFPEITELKFDSRYAGKGHSLVRR